MGSNFGNDGTGVLSEALKTNSTLTELKLGCDGKHKEF